MKIRISALLLIFAFAISFSSCKKDDPVTPTDVQALLTSKTWTFVSVTHSDPAYASLAAFASALYTDATYKFNSDGTYNAVILTQSANGTYELSADKTKILFDGETDENTLSVTSSSLKWTDVDGYIYSWK